MSFHPVTRALFILCLAVFWSTGTPFLSTALADDTSPAAPGATPPRQSGDAPAGPAPYKLDDKLPPEQQWRAYLDMAKTNYGFTPEQSTIADSILTGCETKARKIRESMARTDTPPATNGDSVKGAEADVAVALTKLTDEFIYRIDSIAKLDQVQAAEKKGFISPRRKAPSVRPEVGNVAPDFSLREADGKTIALKDYKGKVVVMAFWASWCGACKSSLPEMEKLQKEYSGKPVLMLGVNCGEKGGTNEKAVELIKKANYTFRVGYEGDVASGLYEVTSYPTIYVVGPDGKIVHKQKGLGANGANVLRPIIEKSLKSIQPIS